MEERWGAEPKPKLVGELIWLGFVYYPNNFDDINPNIEGHIFSLKSNCLVGQGGGVKTV